LQNQWTVQLNCSETLQNIPLELESSDQTEFVIQIFDKAEKLLQNIDFRYFKALYKIDIEPLLIRSSAERRSMALVTFHHAADCDVNLARSFRNLLNTFKDSIFQSIGLVVGQAQKTNPKSTLLKSQNKRITAISHDLIKISANA